MACAPRRPLRPSACAYWRLVLARRPEWMAEVSRRRPHLVRELVAKLLHVPHFGATELGLLAALSGLPHALDETLRAEAVELLRFRAREPSAARFAPDAHGTDDETIAQWCSAEGEQDAAAAAAFGTVEGVVVPLALLRATTSSGAAVEPLGQDEDCLRRAEQLLLAKGDADGS